MTDNDDPRSLDGWVAQLDQNYAGNRELLAEVIGFIDHLIDRSHGDMAYAAAQMEALCLWHYDRQRTASIAAVALVELARQAREARDGVSA